MLQFAKHHSYFRKDFQMLLAVNEGVMKSPHCALGHIWQQQSKKKIFQKLKKIDQKNHPTLHPVHGAAALGKLHRKYSRTSVAPLLCVATMSKLYRDNFLIYPKYLQTPNISYCVPTDSQNKKVLKKRFS